MKKVFSPAQGSVGAFLGGPLAGTFFVSMNFLAIGDTRRARLATIWGITIAAVALWGHLSLSDSILGYCIRIAYPVIVWPIISTQFARARIAPSGLLAIHSNWRVAVVAVLGLLVFGFLGVATSHFLFRG
jgi:hypothetical protein